MALIKCPECGKEVSDKAKACPHCGFEIAQQKQNKSRLGCLFWLLIAVIFIGPCLAAIMNTTETDSSSYYQSQQYKKQIQALQEIKKHKQTLPPLKDDAPQAVQEYLTSGLISKITLKGNKIYAYIDKNKFLSMKDLLLSLDSKEKVPIMPASIIYYQSEKEGKDPNQLTLYLIDAKNNQKLYKYSLKDGSRITEYQ